MIAVPHFVAPELAYQLHRERYRKLTKAQGSATRTFVAGRQMFARYSAELAGCESEHRVLAETLLNANPPNNIGFEVYSIRQPQGIEQALEGAGVGFGRQGSAAGAFYQLARPPMKPPLRIGANKPS